MDRLEEIEILTPGQRLKEVRKELGIRQKDLAGTRLSKNYISMFENDKRRINIINATYLSQRINEIAKSKGLNLRIPANYFVKSEKDIVRDKSLELLVKCEDLTGNNRYDIYFNIYKVILLSNKYELLDILADSYFLKGHYLYRDKLYSCSIVHFSQSLFYYTKNGEIEKEGNCYFDMAKIYYKMEIYDIAIAYFNLAGSTKEVDIEKINYNKALTFYKLGQYKLAKNCVDNILLKDGRTLKLENNINENIKKNDKITM